MTALKETKMIKWIYNEMFDNQHNLHGYHLQISSDRKDVLTSTQLEFPLTHSEFKFWGVFCKEPIFLTKCLILFICFSLWYTIKTYSLRLSITWSKQSLFLLRKYCEYTVYPKDVNDYILVPCVYFLLWEKCLFLDNESLNQTNDKFSTWSYSLHSADQITPLSYL